MKGFKLKERSGEMDLATARRIMSDVYRAAMTKPIDLPAPDTLIDYGDGTFGPLMFHFATERDHPGDIANEQGFDYSHIEMNDAVDDDDTLCVEYGKGADDVVGRWTPPERDGWKLVGRNDSENGPVAHYVRKRVE